MSASNGATSQPGRRRWLEQKLLSAEGFPNRSCSSGVLTWRKALQIWCEASLASTLQACRCCLDLFACQERSYWFTNKTVAEQ